MSKPIPERWIVEVRDKHGNKVSRRYFDSKAEALAAVETRHKNHRVHPDGVRVFRAVPLTLVK